MAEAGTSDFFAIYSPDVRRRDVAQLCDPLCDVAPLSAPLCENQEHKEHLEKVMAHWSPPSQAFVDYCKEIHNELPRAFELTHAEMANVEVHLAQGGTAQKIKAFEIIQEAGKRMVGTFIDSGQ
jgi:hypothetical protein